jgi:hypothetical protein
VAAACARAAAAAYLIALPRWRLAEHGRVAADQAYALAVMLPLLVSPHLHTQSLVLLFIPLAIALRGHFAPDEGAVFEFAHQSAVVAVLLALYALLFALWLATALGFAPMVLLVAGAFAACAWRWPHPNREPGRRDCELSTVNLHTLTAFNQHRYDPRAGHQRAAGRGSGRRTS